MPILTLLDNVSLSTSGVGTDLLVDTVSIGRTETGGLPMELLVNTVSAGHASATEFKDMSVIKTIEI